MKKHLAILGSCCLLAALALLVSGGSRGAVLASSPANRHVAQTYPTATAMTTGATTSGVTGSGTSSVTGSVTTSAGIAYSASRPAPVVPAGSTVVSQSATAGGTLVVYRSGTLYYNVTYASTGRYTYTVTRVPGVASTTVTAPSTSGVPNSTTSGSISSVPSALPKTGGGDPGAPALPLWPALLAGVLSALGLTIRRLAR